MTTSIGFRSPFSSFLFSLWFIHSEPERLELPQSRTEPSTWVASYLTRTFLWTFCLAGLILMEFDPDKVYLNPQPHYENLGSVILAWAERNGPKIQRSTLIYGFFLPLWRLFLSEKRFLINWESLTDCHVFFPLENPLYTVRTERMIVHFVRNAHSAQL